MTNKNEGKTMGLGAEMVREGYEASVISRMAGAAAALLVGGTVSEIMDGVFDDIVSTIGGAVDDVVDGISDFVGGLLGLV